MSAHHNFFHRTVSCRRTRNGTSYEHVMWWNDLRIDVWVGDVCLRSLSNDELAFFVEKM